MCKILVSRYACGCEHRDEVDCKKFAKQKKKGLSFLKMLPQVRFLVCPDTKYTISSKATSCEQRDCPKRKRHVSRIPVVLKDTARGTTGFLYRDPAPAPEPPVRRLVPAPAPAPIHRKLRADARDQMKHNRTKERGHDIPRREKDRAPPVARQPLRDERREDKACNLKLANGHHLAKRHEGTHADPRRRHADRLGQDIELPKFGDVAARRDGATIRPAHRVASQHGVLVCEPTPPRAHRSDRQRSHHVQEPARPRHRVVDSWHPPVNVPARPRAPVHDYGRAGRYRPISKDVERFRYRDSRTRIPEPAIARRQRSVGPPPPPKDTLRRRAAPPPPPKDTLRRTMAPARAPRDIPNPMFVKKRHTVPAPKYKKKKSLMGRISKLLRRDVDDNDSELSFRCVGLPPEKPVWKSDHLVMMPEPVLTYR